MKKIILVRHAKSSWEHHVIDHERPLNKRGFSDAELVSKNFFTYETNIDLVLSSDAVRAKTTANIFIETLSIGKHIVRLESKLYDFSGENLINVIKNCSNTINNLMIFGHNHAITAFVNNFGSTYIENVPTCGVVEIEFQITNWKDLKPGITVNKLFPKDLR